MSQVSSAPSPLAESVSPLLWGAASSSPAGIAGTKRSSPIMIVRTSVDDSDSEDDFLGSFQHLNLGGRASDEFRVGSLPSRRRPTTQHGISLPAAPLLRSTRRTTPSIPPISLTEGADTTTNAEKHSTSPSYGSLRESQLAGRFLDGPSSYRDRHGHIQWRHQHPPKKVHFTLPTFERSPGERMKEFREQQQSSTSSLKSDESSQLSNLLLEKQQQSLPIQQQQDTTPQLATSLTLHDQDKCLFLHRTEYGEEFLSTSLTGLELLQRGLQFSHTPLAPPPQEEDETDTPASPHQEEDPYYHHHEVDHHHLHNDNDDHHHHHDEDDYHSHDQDDSPVFDLDME